MSFNVADFYCTKCGHKGIPLMRPRGHQHKKNHLKKLYCIFCKEEINHVECRNAQEVNNFLKNFKEKKYESRS